MKKLMKALATVLLAALLAVGAVATFIGAALQESYKLHPLTEQEVMGG